MMSLDHGEGLQEKEVDNAAFVQGIDEIMY